MKQFVISMALFTLNLLILTSASTYKYASKKNVENTEQTDKSSNISYSVNHDDKYLTVNLNIDDVQIQRELMMRGLNVWIDQSGKKAETFGIKYPVIDRDDEDADTQREMPPRRRGDDSAEKPDISEMMKAMFTEFQNSAKSVELLGFVSEGSVQRITEQQENPLVLADIDMDDDGVMHYTVQIPLENIFTDSKYDDGKLSLSIKFEEKQMPQRGGGQGMGTPPSGGGMGGPGGGGGMPPSGGGGGRPPQGQGGQPGGSQSQSSVDFCIKAELID